MLERLLKRDPPPVLVVVAHPDDETIGAGSLLPRLRNSLVLHLTDGAPRDPRYAHDAGFADRMTYAHARRAELEQAMTLAEFDRDALRCLHWIDQEAVCDMASGIDPVDALIDECAAEFVLTHPYEGGHPDHDAAAFIVQSTLVRRAARGARLPIRVEMAFYHQGSDGMVTGAFLPAEGLVAVEALLTPEAEALKQRMFACYRSQTVVLKDFSTRVEHYRVAPTYDFDRAPHPGRLFYEEMGWMDGETWRMHAAAAVARSSIGGGLRT